MLQSSRYVAVLLGLALATPLLGACAASASFKAGGEEAKAPPPPEQPHKRYGELRTLRPRRPLPPPPLRLLPRPRPPQIPPPSRC